VTERLEASRGWRGILRRLAAALYDGLLVGSLLMLCTALALLLAGGRSLAGTESGALAYAYRGALIVVVVAYFGVSWTRSGETLGMKAWGLRLVRGDGDALRWRDVLLRLLLSMPPWLLAVAVGLAVLARRLPPWALAPGFLPLLALHATLLWSSQSLHDRLSRTRILQVRTVAS
jgi:uncharacterized RDD family membrane protein YckC